MLDSRARSRKTFYCCPTSNPSIYKTFQANVQSLCVALFQIVISLDVASTDDTIMASWTFEENGEVIIIIIKVFIKHKILSVETILKA